MSNTKNFYIIPVSILDCYFSENFTDFIIFRVLQCIASSCLIIPPTILLNDIFNSKKFGKVIGVTTGYDSIELVTSPLNSLLVDIWDKIPSCIFFFIYFNWVYVNIVLTS